MYNSLPQSFTSSPQYSRIMNIPRLQVVETRKAGWLARRFQRRVKFGGPKKGPAKPKNPATKFGQIYAVSI